MWLDEHSLVLDTGTRFDHTHLVNYSRVNGLSLARSTTMERATWYSCPGTYVRYPRKHIILFPLDLTITQPSRPANPIDSRWVTVPSCIMTCSHLTTYTCVSLGCSGLVLSELFNIAAHTHYCETCHFQRADRVIHFPGLMGSVIHHVDPHF